MKKNILVIAAHPDDEAIGCAGTIYKHTQNGDEVHLMFMTNGEGARGFSKQRIAKRRKNALRIKELLNIKSVKFLKFPDNEMDTVSKLKIIKQIEKDITKLAPYRVYTHSHGDLNVDHKLCFEATITACRPQPGMSVKEIFSFEIPSSTDWSASKDHRFNPNFYVDISRYTKIKIKALEIYKDEMREEPHTRSIKNIERLMHLRGNTVGYNAAEAFEVIRIID